MTRLVPLLALLTGCVFDTNEAPDGKDWFDEVPDNSDDQGDNLGEGDDGGTGEDGGGDEGSDEGGEDGTGGSTGTDPDPDPDPWEVFGISEVAIYELGCFMTFEIWASAFDCEECTLAFDAHLLKVDDTCGVGPSEMYGQYTVVDGHMYWLHMYRGVATYGGGVVRWDTGDYEMYGFTYAYSGYMLY